jgi:V-type H+-transporting ATPase subunit C
MSDEYWIISVPGKSTPRQSYDEVCQATGRDQLSQNYIFNIPELKVGTLDSLVALSDDLARLDGYIEGVTKKLTQFFFNDVLVGDRNRFAENLVVGTNGVDPIRYVTEFQWDHAKYPTKQSLRTLSEIISKATTHIESELKLRSQSYNTVKQNLDSLEKKQTGSLLTRNLNDVIKKEHFLLGSEYLKTLLVCVPKVLMNEWYAKYESLCAMIVPRTTELITQDQDYALFSVTLFQKTEDTFRHKCRENKFTVRDFIFDEKALANERDKIRELETERQKLHANLVRWLKINFGEVFSASIHIKALRVFVESVLRFGLPVNFVAIVIHPTRKSTKRLRDVLDQLFGYLDQSNNSRQDEQIDIPGVFSASQEYYPYVYFKLDLDYIDMNKK